MNAYRNYSTVDLPLEDPNLVILVVDTGVRRTLVDGEYNARRESCISAASKLGKPSLRDAGMADLNGWWPLININIIIIIDSSVF